MAKKTAPLLPATDELLHQFGVRLRLARLRRRLSAKQVAERAGMSPMTLRNLEHGEAGVTMGAYLSVMQVLGIEKDLNLLGQADTLGRELQDAQLSIQHIRVTNNKTPIKASSSNKITTDLSNETLPPPLDQSSVLNQPHQHDWIDTNQFTSSEALADLLDAITAPTAPAASKKD
ncbi:MAG: helix-turn-helix transcriptional regulator [Pseudomonadota bacterium]